MLVKNRFVRLDTIAGYIQTEDDGDEIYLQLSGKKIAPAKKKFLRVKNEPTDLGIEIPLSETQEWLELELWEFDKWSSDDLLGTFKLKVDEVAEDFSTELQRAKDSTARYILGWSLIEIVTRAK